MTTAKETIETVEEINKLNDVRKAWAADRGYVIVAFSDYGRGVMGTVTNMAQEANYRPFDADDDWLVEGKECVVLHFAHEDRGDLIK
jgi:uncharacterized protein (DUF2147 family)